MEPVRFEIIADDKTKPGTQSAEQNVDVLTDKIQQQKTLVQSLQIDIQKLQAQQKKNRAGGGVVSPDEINFTESLKRKLNELKLELISLQNEKKKNAATPVIPTQAMNSISQAGKGMSSLSFSVQQVARELPSLSMGLPMFFLAISNNLPILADSISKAKNEYKELINTGQKATPVWKQMLGSIGSWQTMMIVGITLLTVYGKEIVSWGKKILTGKDAVIQLLNAEQEMAMARQKATVSIKKQQTELDILYAKLKDSAASTRERATAANEWVKRYPQYAGVLNGEILNIEKLKDAYKTLSKEIYARSVVKKYADRASDIAIRKENEEIKRRYQLVTLTKARDKYNASLSVYDTSTGQVRNAAAIEVGRAKENLDEQQKIYDDILSNVRKYEANYQTIIKRIDSVSLFNPPEEGTYDYWKDQKERAENVLKSIKSDVIQTLDEVSKKGGDLYSVGVRKEDVDKYVSATKNFTKAKKELEAYDKGEKTKSTSNVSDNVEDASLKAQKRVNDLKLQLIRDGYERQKAEVKRQLQEQLSDIAKDERERMQALQRARKAGLNVSESQVKSVSAMSAYQRNLAQDVYMRQMERLYEDHIDNLSSKYEDYTYKRISIEKKYNEEVRELMILREEAEGKGDKNAIKMLTSAISRATAQKGKDLMQVSFSQFRESPDFVRAFEDLRNTSTDTLQYLIQQMEEYKGVAAEAWNPEDLREYTTTLQEISDELMERNPFDVLIQKRKELSRAEEEMRSAQDALENVRAGVPVISGVKIKNGSLYATYLSEDAALKNLIKSKDKYNRIETDTLKVERKVTDQAYELFDLLSSVGNTVGGVQGEILSLLGDFGVFTTDMIDGITAVSQTGVNALSAMEKASVILTIVSTGIQLLQKLEEVTPDAYSRYLEYDAKIEEINNLKDAVLSYELAVLKAQQAERGWFGDDSLNNLKDYKEQQLKVLNEYMAKAMEAQAVYQNKKGGGWLTGVLNYGLLGAIDSVFGTNILGNKYAEGTTAAVNNLRIETRKKSKGFLGSGIGSHSQKTEDLQSWIKKQSGWENAELFNDMGLIDKDLAQEVIDKFGKKLVGQTKETLEELIKLREQYDEYVEQLREYVSSLYSPLVDDMVSGLWDWVDEGKDAMDSFKDYAKDTFREIVSDMLNSLIMKRVFAGWQDEIADMYEKYSGSDTDMADFAKAISEKVKELTDKYADELPYLQELLKQIFENFSIAGIDFTSDSSAQQSGKATVISQVTEETATRLDGTMIAQTNRLISVDNNISELRAQLDRALSPLLNIEQNTRDAADKLEGIADDIAQLRRDGIIIKD